ncbi:two-component regulator propeller domain-containing protein [Pontibacter oryzae]|nr:two-component regulator propeller domain-containing protein [Pontibacter oryzae]
MRLLILLCLVLVNLPLPAQQYNIRSWAMEQGLPQGQVVAIQQDAKGYLWLATRGGLSRFNGIEFKTYTKSDGLGSNNIATLFLDSRQRLWIGTSDAGLVQHNGVSFKKYGRKQGLEASTVTAIAEDKTGKLWLATDNGIYTLVKNQLLKYTSLPAISYTAIATSNYGEIWIGSERNGLYVINGTQTENFTTANSPLPSDHVTALLIGKDEEVWIGTELGLALADNRSVSKVTLPKSLNHSHISSLTQDHYQNLWIGLHRNGLLKYSQGTFTRLTRNNGLRTNRIAALATDTEGNLWIGTSGYGLQQYKAPWFIKYSDFPDYTEPRITAIAQTDSSHIWLGTDEGALAKLKHGIPSWLPSRPWPDGTTIYSFLPENKGSLWVNTSNGIWHIRGDSNTHYTFADALSAIDVYNAAQGRQGQLYFATSKGVAVLQDGKLSLLPYTGGKLHAHTVKRDSKRNIWVGTEEGVFLIENGKLTRPRQLKDLNPPDIRSITEDKSGNLYFAAYNTGILVLQNDQPTLYTSDDGLPSESVKVLQADSAGNLWVSTNNDLLKIRLPFLQKEGMLTYRSYASSNGFKDLEVCDNAILPTKDGVVWFGTTKGLTKYLPSLDRRNKVYPNLVLKDVMLYAKPTNWEELGFTPDSMTGLPENLHLSHSQNYLAFNFHGICLSGPDMVKYKYRLVGHETEWSPVTSRTFTSYANLTPGTYTFELMAQNNDGYWTPQPLTYTFSIVPPIWRREWFVGLLLVLVAGSVLSIVRLREKNLVEMNTLLEMKVNHRTRLLERKNKEKEILLQEIHHRVKNNLQIVISLLNLQARHVADPLAKEMMQALRSRVRSMSLLHERLYRYDSLENIDLEEYFLEICESLYASYGVSMSRIALELDVPNIKLDIDSAITLGLIVNELVSNTLKYAFQEDEQGVLRIELVKHDEVQYTLTVSDNGHGLPEDFYQKQQQGQSFGLKLVQSLSKKLDGNIRFFNKNGTKSILYFVLPS